MNRRKDARRTALAAKIRDRWLDAKAFAAISFMDMAVEYAMAKDRDWTTAEPDPVSGHPIADPTDPDR